MSAVSKRFTPASMQISMWRRASSACTLPIAANRPSPPSVIVPKLSTETSRPLAPNNLYSMLSPQTSIPEDAPGLTRMIVDDLPAGLGLAQHQGETACRIAAARLRSFECIPAVGQRVALANRAYGDFGKGQRAHGFGRRVAAPVASQNGLDASVSDVAAYEGGLGRIVVVRGEGGQVAAVPGGFGPGHHGADLVALGKHQWRAEKEKEGSDHG